MELSAEQTKKVTKRITELGDRKEIVTQDDLPFIVSDVLKHSAPENRIKLVSYMVSLAYGLKPLASVKVSIMVIFMKLILQETDSMMHL